MYRCFKNSVKNFSVYLLSNFTLLLIIKVVYIYNREKNYTIFRTRTFNELRNPFITVRKYIVSAYLYCFSVLGRIVTVKHFLAMMFDLLSWLRINAARTPSFPHTFACRSFFTPISERLSQSVVRYGYVR